MLAAAVVAVSLGLISVACNDGDGGGDEDEVRAVIEQLVDAWNNQDFDAYSAAYTENGLRAALADAEDQSPEGLREAFELFSADERIVVREVGNVQADGDTATVDGEFSFEAREGAGPVSLVLASRDTLIREGGVWRIDSSEFLSPDAPDGVTLVPIDATEFSFTFDAAQAASGNIAFAFENTGAQQHHMHLDQIPEDLDIEQALMSEEEPEGLVSIGGIPPIDAGDTRAVVFTADLPPGRYLMVCFLPDTDGTPHALKGMWKDFTVE
jgi:ketosteroid isomerase-like protein